MFIATFSCSLFKEIPKKSILTENRVDLMRNVNEAICLSQLPPKRMFCFHLLAQETSANTCCLCTAGL
jgi:hypothetical protein